MTIKRLELAESLAGVSSFWSGSHGKETSGGIVRELGLMVEWVMGPPTVNKAYTLSGINFHTIN